MIASAGHEIASHGYGHELLYNLTPAAFRADVQRSIAIIESQVGRRPQGFRAPAFSVTASTRWAGPILADFGFRYSSSIFPVRKKRYGIPDAPRTPHRWPDCPLMEFPLTTLRVMGTNVPVCGGGYMRLLPGWIHARAIRRLNAEGQPAVVYLHPYEFAPDEVREFKRFGLAFSARRHLMQSLWRSRVPVRLERILHEFAFAPMIQVLEEYLGRTAVQPSSQADRLLPSASLPPRHHRS
jgi:polysaccharide deacetylase family protein (PEP-CTERM system associated)